MKDAYRLAFYDVVRESQDKSGYELPENLEAYVVMLLAHYIDRPDFLPETSFAEAYLLINNNNVTAKDLGDACLFVTGVFPTYGKSKGLKRKYFQDIGIGSYERVAETLNGSLFVELATHFHFLSDFIELTIHSSATTATAKYQHNNLFR